MGHADGDPPRPGPFTRSAVGAAASRGDARGRGPRRRHGRSTTAAARRLARLPRTVDRPHPAPQTLRHRSASRWGADERPRRGVAAPTSRSAARDALSAATWDTPAPWAWRSARQGSRTHRSRCSCTAIPTRRTCGARRSRRSPRRAGARSRRTWPATATPTRCRPAAGRGPTTSRRWTTSSPSTTSRRWRSSRTTGAGSSACAGRASGRTRCAPSWSAGPASSPTAAGTDSRSGMRTPDQGERMIASLTRESFGEILRTASPHVGDEAIDEYWKGFDGDERRAAHLTLYRSGDFEELARLRRLRSGGSTSRRSCCGAPTTRSRPSAGAHRFADELARRDAGDRRGRRALPPRGRPRARRPGDRELPQ